MQVTPPSAIFGSGSRALHSLASPSCRRHNSFLSADHNLDSSPRRRVCCCGQPEILLCSARCGRSLGAVHAVHQHSPRLPLHLVRKWIVEGHPAAVAPSGFDLRDADPMSHTLTRDIPGCCTHVHARYEDNRLAWSDLLQAEMDRNGAQMDVAVSNMARIPAGGLTQ